MRLSIAPAHELHRPFLCQKSARIRRLQPLPNNPGHLRPSTFGQSFKFVERFVGANPRLGTKFDSNQDGALVMLMGNVVGLSQMITSIAENLTISLSDTSNPRYATVLLTLGAGSPLPKEARNPRRVSF